MSQTVNSTVYEDEQATIQQQNLRRLAFLTAALAVIPAAFYTYLFVSQRDWRYLLLIVTFLVLIPASFWVIRRNQKGDHILAAWALIGIIFYAALGVVALISNVGSAVSIATLILALFIGIQTLPQRLLMRVVFAGIFASLIIGLEDIVIPYSRIFVPVVEQFSITITLFAILAFLALIITQFGRLRLVNKILVAYVSIAALISIAFGQVTSLVLTNILTENAGKSLQPVAQSRGQALGSMLAQQIDAIQALSTNADIQWQIARSNRTHDPDLQKEMERINRFDAIWRQADAANNNDQPLVNGRLYNLASSQLRNFQQSFPAHVEMMVTDVLGGLVAVTNRTSDYYQADEEWWQMAYNNGTGGIYIGVPEYDESARTNIIRIAVPVRDRATGSIIGILQTAYSITEIQQLLSQPVGETGKTEYVFLSEPVERLGLDGIQIAPPELIQALKDLEQRSYIELQLGQTDSILSAAPILSLNNKYAVDSLPWKAIVYQAKTETIAPVQQQVRIINLLGVIISTIVSVMAIHIARRLSKPILDLTQTVEQFKAGNMEVQAQIASDDEIGYLANTFNELTTQIRQMLFGLEQRVAERTAELEQAIRRTEDRARELELVSEVAKAAASQQQPDALLSLVTSLVSEKFSFYHVGIFLIDENREYAVLRAANSPGGKRMLERQHRLKIGQEGIVGNVAQTGKPRIALDVGQDAVYFDNPDLPETRSEVALPLQTGDEIIGVLDVQSTEENAFSEENLKTLSILADQISIAIYNSRLVTDLQRALLEAQALQRQYLAQSWKSLTGRKYLGYHKTLAGGRPVNQTIQRAEIVQALTSGKYVTIYPKGSKTKDGDETPALAIPIRLREQVIGVLNIRSQDPNRRWDEDEIALLSSISDRLALALENARLFEETTRRALRERTVSEITTKIRSKTDPESMIQTALAELRQVLGASHVEILPYTPPSETQIAEKGK